MHSVILYFLTVLLSCQVLIKWKTIKASIEICPFSFKWDESTTISWIFSGISRVYLQKFWDPPCILPPAFSFGWTKLFFWFRYPFNRQQYCLAKFYRWDSSFFSDSFARCSSVHIALVPCSSDQRIWYIQAEHAICALKYARYIFNL